MFFQSIRMAWSSICANKMRSFLTMLGIIIGVMSLVVLVSIANGATSDISNSISSMGTNLLTVSIADGQDVPLKLEELDEIMELDNVSEVSPLASDSFTVKYRYNSETASVKGVNAYYGEIAGIELASGRWIRTLDVDNHTNAVIINQDLAMDVLGVSNTEDAIGMELRVNGIPCRVVGVLEASSSVRSNRSSYEAYMAYTFLERLSENVSSVGSFVVSADSDQVLDRAEEALNSWLLDRFGQDEEAFTITNQSEVAETMESVMNTMAIMLGGIAAISLLVGGIGIMNIMLVSVTERTREIGIRKAIGAGEGSIMLQFLIEALMISLMGCLIGIGCSWVALRVILIVTETTYAMNELAVTVAVVFSTAIGLIFGLYPAAKAARKKPIDALRYTG